MLPSLERSFYRSRNFIFGQFNGDLYSPDRFGTRTEAVLRARHRPFAEPITYRANFRLCACVFTRLESLLAAANITEGFHNKMELTNRRAYGFCNFQNYRLRVKVLCSWNHSVMGRAPLSA